MNKHPNMFKILFYIAVAALLFLPFAGDMFLDGIYKKAKNQALSQNVEDLQASPTDLTLGNGIEYHNARNVYYLDWDQTNSWAGHRPDEAVWYLEDGNFLIMKGSCYATPVPAE